MKSTPHIIKSICKHCLGAGWVYRGRRKHQCEKCKGTGEVESVVNEVEAERK